MPNDGRRAPLLTRRNTLIAGAATAGMLTVLSKPSDVSGARDPYFVNLQAALREARIATPTLVIDKSRLDQNIEVLKNDLPPGMAYRVVTKSLPSTNLISRVREKAGTDRLMTFNLPMLLELARTFPGDDQLLGKPLPVEAARQFFEAADVDTQQASAKIQWLIDTPLRFDQYAALADALDTTLRLNIELDVGLHRGGFEPGEALGNTLSGIRDHPRLIFSGFMGYEPHIPGLPTAFGLRDRALKKAWRLYSQSIELATSIYGVDLIRTITRNAAGSPTYRLYEDTTIANEVAAGSVLVKPQHFDTDLLRAHQSASFIATPVLKAFDETRTPAVEAIDGVRRFWDPNLDKTIFIHGGHWLAEPVDPPGLALNPIFGRSSNQEQLNGGRLLDVQPDDFVFLRPTQSEAVFMQFGDIAVYDEGAITEYWPVFAASA